MAQADAADPWTLALKRGDLAAAWEISDAVLRARAGVTGAPLPRHWQPVWNGDPLEEKRVLVRCYHGLGDTIQFIRYAPMISAVAAEVTVWAQPALLEILRGARGIHQLLPLHDGQPEAEYDVDVEIMELPHVFRSTLATLPAEVPYLHATRAPLPWGGPEMGLSFNVGLVWQAGDWDPRRSVPVSLLAAALGEVPGVTLHALQRGAGLAEWQSGFGPVSGSDRVEEAAGVMQALDLIVSVDSFPAHLAGALGRPVWTLLHSQPDWRWMEGRDDSPWYPTMQLFRQTRAGEWGPVIRRAAAALETLARGTRPPEQ